MPRSQCGPLLLLAWAMVSCCGPAIGQETADYFKRNCANCHTIGGGRTNGPDLKNVTQRKDADWLARFILDPKKVIDDGDSYANALVQEYRGVIMPKVDKITPERAEALVQFLAAESKPGHVSKFAGSDAEMPTGPFTQAQIDHGRALFVGQVRLKNGGPPCMACHTVQGLSSIGGGALGPDLTLTFNKLGPRKPLGAWLTSPPTPTMQTLYADDKHPLTAGKDGEIVHLVAFLEHLKDGQEETTSVRLNFFLLGLAGTAGAFVLFDYVWRRRFRAVRRPLVQGNDAKGIA